MFLYAFKVSHLENNAADIEQQFFAGKLSEMGLSSHIWSLLFTAQLTINCYVISQLYALSRSSSLKTLSFIIP